MKVEQKREFTPITMILETETEAKIIWHLLNTAPANLPEPIKDYEIIAGNMWHLLDDVFSPKDN